ncbi:MAG: hypothetical protein HY314_14695 [Acidobacteria bacterium]|nr:hypothetical protein [Acidobacteriota bacterium]
MTRGIQLARPFFIGLSLLAFPLVTTLLAHPSAAATTTNQVASVSYPSIKGMTGDSLFSKLLEHNRLRELHLQQYSVARTYLIANDKGKVRAETRVVLQYRAPGTKEYTIVSEKGSGFVRKRVFKQVLESEVETAAGRSRHDSSITPANYSFELLGEEDVDDYHCFVVRAIPKRKDKYLFDGKIWIEANEFAIVKIAGRPAKNPSFWIKRVEFVRRYQKIGEFWLSLKDESITQVRIFGKNILTIDYANYEVIRSNRGDKAPIADSGREPQNTTPPPSRSHLATGRRS